MTGTLVFDVNETLSDLSPMGRAFESVGAAPELAATWFASVLRDGFALQVTGDTAEFSAIAGECARIALAGQRLTVSLEEAVTAVLSALRSLRVHDDVVPGIRALHESGYRLVTLSNGAATLAESLMTGAGIVDCFDLLLTVEGRSGWKPAPASYARLADELKEPLSELTLVAVHPWDIHGASRAGMGTVWLSRDGGRYPAHFARPTRTVASIGALAH